MKEALLKKLKPVLTVLGAGCALLALGYWGYALWQNREALLSLHWGWKVWLGLGLCLGVYGLLLWVSVILWRRILSILGTQGELVSLAGVFTLSQLGRYLPLNVAQYVGRVYLGARMGLAPVTTSLSVVAELMVLLGLAVAIAIAGTVFWSVGIPLGPYADHWGWKLLVLIAGILFAIVALKPALRLAARFLPDKWELPSNIQWNWRDVVGLVLPALTVFFLLGVILDLLSWGILGLDVHRPFFLTWAFALAWTIGLITPGAPAGIGVREAVLLVLLSIYYTEDQALVLSLYSRLVTMIGDGLFALLYCGFCRRQCRLLLGKRAPDSAP